jgi:hypothetical protein
MQLLGKTIQRIVLGRRTISFRPGVEYNDAKDASAGEVLTTFETVRKLLKNKPAPIEVLDGPEFLKYECGVPRSCTYDVKVNGVEEGDKFKVGNLVFVFQNTAKPDELNNGELPVIIGDTVAQTVGQLVNAISHPHNNCKFTAVSLGDSKGFALKARKVGTEANTITVEATGDIQLSKVAGSNGGMYRVAQMKVIVSEQSAKAGRLVVDTGLDCINDFNIQLRKDGKVMSCDLEVTTEGGLLIIKKLTQQGTILTIRCYE